ncbi:MAG: hypothetical protein AB1631_07640 [Acidobacteriota bacterium]
MSRIILVVLLAAISAPRLNEFPEWYTVDENALYKITGASERVAPGSELIAGIRLTTGRWIIEPVKK